MDGKNYDSDGSFSNKKDAEQSAASVAYRHLTGQNGTDTTEATKEKENISTKESNSVKDNSIIQVCSIDNAPDCVETPCNCG